MRNPLLLRATPFLALLSVLGGTGAGAGYGLHLHDRYRAELAAAKERAAVEHYRGAVRALVQPVYAAELSLTRIEDEEFQIRQDVLVHGDAPAALAALNARLQALPVPVSVRAEGMGLRTQLASLSATAARIKRGADKTRSEHLIAPELSGGYDFLSRLRVDYAAALAKVLPTGGDVSEPDDSVADRTASGYLLHSDQTCLEANDEVYALGITPKTFAHQADRFADEVDRTLAVLRRTPAPPELRSQKLALRGQLEAGSAVPAALRDIARAARARHAEEARLALRRLQAGLEHFTQLSQDYKELGISWCADYFSVDNAPASSGGLAA